VAASLDGADKSGTTLRHALWIATPLLVLLVALMTWLFVSGALQPVEAIREEVEEIKASTMDRRVPVPDTDDEIQRLAVTMNEMLDRLETSSLRQREFVSDASHELRSPIASMRAELEVALAHPEAADWPEVAQRVLGERMPCTTRTSTSTISCSPKPRTPAACRSPRRACPPAG
jgi:signal transduction histidine kinase